MDRHEHLLRAGAAERLARPAVWLRRGLERDPRSERDRLERAVAERTAQLAEAEEKYRRLVEEIPLVTFIDALDDHASTLYISPQIEAILGYRVEQWMENPDFWLTIMHPDDRERVIAENLHHNATGAPFRAEYRLLAVDGREVWFLGQAAVERDADGKPRCSRGYLLDITERKGLEQRLAHAFHDPVTGLPNRALFTDRVQHGLEGSRPEDGSIAVVFIDLDDFKTVNDTVGHAAGDTVLAQVGARLRLCLRPGDTAARLGGDEFAVLLEGCREASAVEAVVARLGRAFGKPFVLDDREVFVSASLGVAIHRGDDDNADELLRNADVAMYRAKSQGKSRFEVYEPRMRQEAIERLELTTDLQGALRREELLVEYQPIVALKTGMVAGVEALVRWPHPQLGLVSSSDFIRLAEDTGLIVPLGRAVLRQACAEAARWTAAAQRPFVSVNLSLRELQEGDLVSTVELALAEAELDPRLLVIEVTETVLMTDPETIAGRLAGLEALGVRIAVDDFGTGYSSLSYLNELPVDIVKIAKPFVDRLGTTSDDRLARAVLGIGSALGMSTVAEGVETRAQHIRLQTLRCDYGQGFCYARPMRAEQLQSIVSAGVLRAA